MSASGPSGPLVHYREQAWLSCINVRQAEPEVFNIFQGTSLQIRVCTGKLFSLFLIQTYVVGTQKNRLNEMVLLSTQNICFN